MAWRSWLLNTVFGLVLLISEFFMTLCCVDNNILYWRTLFLNCCTTCTYWCSCNISLLLLRDFFWGALFIPNQCVAGIDFTFFYFLLEQLICCFCLYSIIFCLYFHLNVVLDDFQIIAICLYLHFTFKSFNYVLFISTQWFMAWFINVDIPCFLDYPNAMPFGINTLSFLCCILCFDLLSNFK